MKQRRMQKMESEVMTSFGEDAKPVALKWPSGQSTAQ